MSEVVDAGIATVRKKMFPWFILAALIALMSAGGTGMYFGYQIAEGENATERLELVQGFNAALTEKEARRQEAEAKSRLIEGTFLTTLRGLKGESAESMQQILEETKKAIYDTCKVPDSGVDMINNRIDQVNQRIRGGK